MKKKSAFIALLLAGAMAFGVGMAGCKKKHEEENPDPGIEDVEKTYVKVTFDSKGGSAVTEKSVESGAKVTAPEEPSKEGYVFGGWYTDDGCTTEYDFDGAVTANITLYAKWVANADVVAVEKVELSKSAAILTVGDEDKLTATVSPDNATKRTVSWSSDKTGVVTVDSNGNVKAIAAGTAVITATADGKSATCTVTVNEKAAEKVSVESVTLDKSTASVEEGKTLSLTATVNPSDATNKKISWSSSDDKIATVDTNGKVTGVKAGEATITVTTEDGGHSATCKVTVTAKATDPEKPDESEKPDDKEEEGDKKGETITAMTVTYEDAPKAYKDEASKTYTEGSSTKHNLYEVTESMPFGNKPVAFAVGSGNNKWTQYDDKSAGTFIQSNGAGTIEFDLTPYSGEITLTIISRTTGKDKTGRYYTISGHGDDKYSAGKDGNGITSTDQTDVFELEGGYKYTLVCSGGLRFKSFAFAPKKADEGTGGGGTVTPEPVKEYKVTFNANGHGTAPAQAETVGGKVAKPADLTADGYSFGGWYKDEACTTAFDFSTVLTQDTTLYAKWTQAVAGVVNVTGVTLNKNSAALTVDATCTLTATVTPSGATNGAVSWKTSNAEVAEITEENGTQITVTAKGKGTALITVTAEDGGHTATCEITVSEKDAEILPPVANGVKILKSLGSQETAYVTWEAADNAVSYNVYIKPANGTYEKLDAPLVRKYSDYFRADAVGLKAGSYEMKVVPVNSDGTEAAAYAGEVKSINVVAHTREGFAFTDNHVPGAYNMDGTLKSGAKVIYVTAGNAKTVKDTVVTSNKGATTECTGFQAIIDALQKGEDTTPRAFRIIGTISLSDMDAISSSAEGLQIKGKSASLPARNVTIEGIGNDGALKDFGILVRNSMDVELRNFGVLNCLDDCISLDTDNSHIWVHNLDLFYGKGGSGDKAKGDGALDSKGTDYSTYSYNHFWDCGKCNLLGNGDSESISSGVTHLTYHHNWYDHSDSRHPRIRTATVHVYNNYFDGNAKYGVGVTKGASAFVEANYFRSTSQMKPMMSSLQGTDSAFGKDGQTFTGDTGGMIKSYNNKIVGSNVLYIPYGALQSTLNSKYPTLDTTVDFDAYEVTNRDDKVPATVKAKTGGTGYNNFDTEASMYSYTPDTPDEAKENVTKYAGRVDGGDFKWTFTDADDADYAVNSALKSAVTNYTTTLVQVFGISESSSGSGSGSGDSGSGSGDSGSGSGDSGNGSGSGDSGESGSGSGSGDSGNTGGDTGGISGSITVTFDKTGKPSDSKFTVSGNGSNSKGSVTVNGQTLSNCLKMETGTSVSFNLTEAMTVKFYLYDAKANPTLKVDGTKQTAGKKDGGADVLEVSLTAGAHTITKADATNIFCIILSPAAQ